MGITHVIRGEDHVNGTPKYLLLRAALGFGEPPTFAHLPLLVNAQRKKLLRKRHDDVSMATSRTGFLPEAMRNYLSLLGWGPPDGVEVRPIEQVIELFRLEDVNPSPAFFDLKKLEHINGDWIRRLDTEDFVRRALEFVAGDRRRVALSALGWLAQQPRESVERVTRVLRLGRHAGRRSILWEKAMRVPVARDALDGIIASYEPRPGNTACSADQFAGRTTRRKSVEARWPHPCTGDGPDQGPATVRAVRVPGSGRDLAQLRRGEPPGMTGPQGEPHRQNPRWWQRHKVLAAVATVCMLVFVYFAVTFAQVWRATGRCPAGAGDHRARRRTVRWPAVERAASSTRSCRGSVRPQARSDRGDGRGPLVAIAHRGGRVGEVPRARGIPASPMKRDDPGSRLARRRGRRQVPPQAGHQRCLARLRRLPRLSHRCDRRRGGPQSAHVADAEQPGQRVRRPRQLPARLSLWLRDA